MKRTIMILGLALLIQLGLGITIYLHAQAPAQGQSAGPLLSFEPQQVSELEITGTDQQQLVVKKTAAGWVLPGHGDAPADADKITGLLTTLDNIKRPWPVATSADTYRRFKVAKDDFELRLVFRGKDGDLATLLVGSSPGFRKVHARLAGEEKIYDIPFSSYQASLKTADWIDKKILQVDPAKVTALELSGLRLVKKDGKLQLEGLSAQQKTATAKADQLLQSLTGLQVRDLYEAEQPFPEQSREVKLELDSGKIRSYRFAKANKDDYALLRAEGSSRTYEVDRKLWNELDTVQRTDLIAPAATDVNQQAAPSAKDTTR